MKKIFLITIIGLALISVGCLTQQKPISNQPTADQNLNQATSTPPLILENLVAKVPILIYHHIRPISEKDKESDKTFIVSPQKLEEQLKYLKDNNFQTISFANLANYFAGQFSLPEKPIIISFDDGLENQYANALPLLQKYNFTATFFIFTNPIGRSKNYFTWEQVKELVSLDMEIGSHGKYHYFLNKINQEELKKEVVESKEMIEKNLNQKITAFSYPFGAYNDQVVTLVKEAGYLSARDIVNGVNHTRDDLYQLKAYFVTEDFPRFISIVKK